MPRGLGSLFVRSVERFKVLHMSSSGKRKARFANVFTNNKDSKRVRNSAVEKLNSVTMDTPEVVVNGLKAVSLAVPTKSENDKKNYR